MFAGLSHLTRKTSDPVSYAMITSLTAQVQCVLLVTSFDGKELANHAVVDGVLKASAYFADHFQVGSKILKKNITTR